MMKKAQAEFAQVAQERKEQTAWVHQVFSAAASQQPMNNKALTTMILHDDDTTSSSSSRWLLRELDRSEISVLQSNGCRCTTDDWSRLRLLISLHKNSQQQEETTATSASTIAKLLRQFVTHTTFEGCVVLCLDPTLSSLEEPHEGGSNATSTPSWTNAALLPRGIHHNGVISNSILHVQDSWIWHNTVISDTFVASRAVVLRCGILRGADSSSSSGTEASSSTSSKNNIHDPPLHLTVGPESGGGRPLKLSAEATMMDVQEQLQAVDTNKALLQDEGDQAHDKASVFSWNILGKNTILRDTSTVESIYMHATASIEGAASVKRTILFPQASIGAASTVCDTRLQWKACIGSQSCISDTLLMEYAEAGPQSLVAHAVLGPDTHVSAGEVHASVLGPNTNAHHQSLVIGLLWPWGRGNVGYGANAGSNHTGRLPDQESCAGEGTFWGLSCVIVFPVNLLDAPYSIVAAGTTLKSQRLPPMPFSLLVNDNTLIPAWVLSSSLYTLVRSEIKFANRRKAKRHAYYTGWKIMRPEMIDLCRMAREILQSPSSSSLSAMYKWSDKTREKGIRAYTDCIQRYLLQGLLSFLLQEQAANGNLRSMEDVLAQEFSNIIVPDSSIDGTTNSSNDAKAPAQWPSSPWDETISEWVHQRKLLLQEFVRPSSTWTFWVSSTLLPKLISLENEYAERVFSSKERDDVRGKAIIPGYKKSHQSAAQDPVIIHVRKAAQETTDKVNMILQQLDRGNQQSRL